MKKCIVKAVGLIGVGIVFLCPQVFAEEKKWSDIITVSGVVEIEAGASSGYDGTDSSDITLSTMELGIDAELNDWVSGSVVLLWEEDDTEPVDLDQAIVTLGNTEQAPYYLSAGKMYIPFGYYETNMISDPLTLEIGETGQTTVRVGYENQGFQGSVYSYKGDIIRRGDDDTINCYGANMGYSFKKDSLAIGLGAGITSNILESDGLGDAFEEAREEFVSNAGGADPVFELDEFVVGYSVNAMVQFGSATFMGEYVGAADDPEYYTNDGAGTEARITLEAPAAYHVEGAYAFELAEKEMVAAITWQGTVGLAGTFPETRLGAALGVTLIEGVGLAAEYIMDDDYSVSDGGTGKDETAVTLQLALEF